MINLKAAYLRERNYSAEDWNQASQITSEKLQFWEGILGTARIIQLAEEHEKIRFHLSEIPYTVSEQNEIFMDIENPEPIPDHPVFAPFYAYALQEGR